ncbi:MAG: hypothetical protein IJ757_05925 [Clostridiales bacterium]|nr:hypothetical protein [Clostridiales bacterium]
MKHIKEVVSTILIGAMLMPLAGCSKKIEPIKAKEFKKAIELVFDDDEYSSYGDIIYVDDDNYMIMYRKADDEDDAEDAWEDLLDDYEDMVDDKKFDGRTRLVEGDGYGYILLNGDSSDKGFGKGYYYGGIYYVEDMVIAIVTTKDKDANRDNINTILRELGLPRP